MKRDKIPTNQNGAKEKDKGEAKETVLNDDDAYTSGSDVVVELTCMSQSQNKLKAYATKCGKQQASESTFRTIQN